MINYTWKVTELYTQTIEGKEDYVVLAHCETIGVDGEYTASVPNVIQFSTEEVTNFIPYADLTEEIIVGWIKEVLEEEGVLDIDLVVPVPVYWVPWQVICLQGIIRWNPLTAK
jgi:hypothetical protein